MLLERVAEPTGRLREGTFERLVVFQPSASAALTSEFVPMPPKIGVPCIPA